jgi:hypothetical protein
MQTLEDNWREYAKAMDFNPDSNDFLQEAFYAGASSLFVAMRDMAIPEDLDQLADEITDTLTHFLTRRRLTKESQH